jgi:hypothetical protein
MSSIQNIRTDKKHTVKWYISGLSLYQYLSILVYFQLNDLKFSIIDKTINLSPKKLKKWAECHFALGTDFLGGRLEFLSLPLFFSGGSGVLSEVNSGGDVWNFYFLLVGEGGGVWNKWHSPPLPGIFKWNSPNIKHIFTC